MNWGYTLLNGAIAFSLALILSYLFGIIARRSSIVDAPDEARKQQPVAIPRLGGVAFMLAILVAGLTTIMLIGGGFRPLSGSALGFTIVCFLVGLWDDIKPPPAKIKLLVLLIAAGIAAYLGLRPAALMSPFGDITSLGPIVIGSALWLLVFTNAANFMDGSNGLSIGSVAVMLAGLCAAMIGVEQSAVSLLPLHLVFTGAVAGFLIHNLRGKLYAGDAGALGLGALFASLGLVSGLEVWTVATLALPFLIDVLMTLIWRAKHKRSWLEAHLDHAYQRLRKNGWSHLETAVLYWGLTATCAAAAVIAAKAGGEAPFIVFCTLCLAGIALWTAHRRSLSANEFQ
jgi:UDP-GlcNAc:undecaprenyl-phosphate GlcNAc-1-phosphate transferase